GTVPTGPPRRWAATRAGAVTRPAVGAGGPALPGVRAGTGGGARAGRGSFAPGGLCRPGGILHFHGALFTALRRRFPRVAHPLCRLIGRLRATLRRAAGRWAARRAGTLRRLRTSWPLRHTARIGSRTPAVGAGARRSDRRPGPAVDGRPWTARARARAVGCRARSGRGSGARTGAWTTRTGRPSTGPRAGSVGV